MTISVDTWVGQVNGQYIDLDGIGTPIWQCHDLWVHYLINVAGGTHGMGYAPSGWTDSVWTSFPTNGVDAVMTRYSGTAGIQKGDVVFWASGSANYPSSHVAIALEAPTNGGVYTMTQNPGPAHLEWLTLNGALGYLRPKNIPTDPGPGIPERRKKKDMLLIHRPNPGSNAAQYPNEFAVTGPNYWVAFATGQSLANQFAAQLGDSIAVTPSLWDRMKAQSTGS